MNTPFFVIILEHGTRHETWVGQTMAEAFTVAYTVARAAGCVAATSFTLTITEYRKDDGGCIGPYDVRVRVSGRDVMPALRGQDPRFTPDRRRREELAYRNERARRGRNPYWSEHD